MMRRVAHPNALKLIEVGDTDDEVVLVTPYIEGGNLLDYLRSVNRLDEDHARSIFLQLVGVLHQAHLNGVVHRDIKLENILISKDAKTVYLADWGFAGDWKAGKLQVRALKLWISADRNPPSDTPLRQFALLRARDCARCSVFWSRGRRVVTRRCSLRTSLGQVALPRRDAPQDLQANPRRRTLFPCSLLLLRHSPHLRHTQPRPRPARYHTGHPQCSVVAGGRHNAPAPSRTGTQAGGIGSAALRRVPSPPLLRFRK